MGVGVLDQTGKYLLNNTPSPTGVLADTDHTPLTGKASSSGHAIVSNGALVNSYRPERPWVTHTKPTLDAEQLSNPAWRMSNSPEGLTQSAS